MVLKPLSLRGLFVTQQKLTDTLGIPLVYYNAIILSPYPEIIFFKNSSKLGLLQIVVLSG